MSGIKLGAKSLRRCLEQPDDIAENRYGVVAMYGGMALANAKLGAVHGFSGTLGGLLHAPARSDLCRFIATLRENERGIVRDASDGERS